ncbi:MAG: pentapeptide repeat-containing protein [Solirubrobacterales bacterium]|nr:pentapeptide repeat-containing protein [Solirubrobacterales bacterium]
MEPLAPDLPELLTATPEALAGADRIELEGVRIDGSDEGDGAVIAAARVRARETELRGVRFDADAVRSVELVDVVLRDCELSNLVVREARLRRVDIRGSRLVGIDLGRAEIRDLRMVDCSMALATLAAATLGSVELQRVNLSESVWMDAALRGVALVDCELSGADFRGASVDGLAIRGATLEGIIGVASLRGLRMTWSDVLASAGALAAALGIGVEPD